MESFWTNPWTIGVGTGLTVATAVGIWKYFSGSKPEKVTNITSYGQGGSGGSGGGRGGAGGNVANIHGIPLQVGAYKVEVGKGGAPGEKGGASSITTPSGEIIIVSGGEGGKNIKN
jgi:hypothetical protein